MGAGEEGTPTNSSKPTSSVQEVPAMPPTPTYADWSSSMQAYYGSGGAPPFFASASPTPHPYMWGQHPLMPPYGTPVPYPALYPPGGIYAHPNMTTIPGAIYGTAELDGKAIEMKDRSLTKKLKGSSGSLIGSKAVTASGSGNDVGTQSGESGSEGSSDASDDNNNQEFSATKKGSFEQMLADGANAQNNAAPANYQATVPSNPVSMPAANLNISMDLWNARPAGTGSMKMRPNQSGVAPSGVMNDQWVPDDRELKRQKRKQSNRESARRSRLRKQAECEELQHKVEALTNDNRTLREELHRLSEECEKLTSENNSIKDELTRLCGPDAVSQLENTSYSAAQLQSRGDEGNR